MPKKRLKSKKKPKTAGKKHKIKPQEEIEEAELVEEQPKERRKSLYQEAEELLRGDALLQGTRWWGRIFYKVLPFAIVAGGILTIHGMLALTRGCSPRREEEMYDQNAIVYRKGILNTLEDMMNRGYSQKEHGPLPADNLERVSVKRYDDLSQLLGRDFRGEISTFSEMVPRNSKDFKIYRIGLDKRDTNLTEANEDFLENHPELREYGVIMREIAEACISEQDNDYKKIAGVCAVVVYNKGNYFVYAGFITPKAVLRLLQNPNEDAERLKEEFAEEFRNAVISGIGVLKGSKIVKDTTYQYFERLNEFLSQRSTR
jgi:hypothetical protein